ncbi:MAG: site-specific DNA-methyltransferase [Rectinema sp.]
MTFNTKLINLLKTDPRFVDDEGELVLAAVQDYAWKINHDLVKLLLSDNEIKAKFFDEIEGHWIFNINTFIDYISQKNFLDNSYTRFRNRIGLTIGGKYLRERGEVALVWPYKDCVLEGGQTKEEEKRKEIFFNEVLAQDEINRLLDPKVLTNFTHYTAKGKEMVTGFKRDENGVIRENLIIKGNNLLALHTLKTQFRGQVKLIYIDPPYNTGNDSFGYNDSFNHSSWLTFMKNRLEIAKSVLREDGVIFIQCDDSEYPYLKVVADEVFGQDKYLVTFYIQVRYAEKTLSERMDFQKLIEQILVYKKNSFKPHKPTEEYTIAKFEWKIVEKGPGKKTTLGNKEAIIFRAGEYEVVKVEPSIEALKETWASGTVLKANASGKFFNDFIGPRTKIDGLGCLYKVFGIGEDGLGYRYFTGPKREGATKGKFYSGVPVSRQDELQDGEAIKEIVIPNFLNLADSFGNCRQEGGVELRSGKKPEELLKTILDMSSTQGDIVLDFFVGTGTTAAVAHKMGRQYIGIEQLEYGENDSVVRLQNVIKGDQSGISKSVHWQGGGDFIYCELMKYNEAFMERIQAAQSSEELMQIWREMAEGSFLNWYVNPAMPEEAVRDFEALGKGENGLEKQKRLLAELLDKNQLYVNLSEIDDAQFNVSEEDKALNKAFYGDSL